MKNEVTRLSDTAHVRAKPGMYVGDVSRGDHEKWIVGSDGRYVKETVSYVPALLKLFDEIVANAVDEGFRTGFKGSDGKFRIEVEVVQHLNEITVKDNGRGIPLRMMDDEPNVTQAEAAVTEMRTSTNFVDDKARVSFGTHGVGATVVNLLSSDFRLQVIGDRPEGRVSFILHSCQGKTQLRSMAGVTRDGGKVYPTSTMVTFRPDWSVFEGVDHLDDVHFALIQKRVSDLAACLPGIDFRFNGKKVDSRDFDTYLSHFSPYARSWKGKKAQVGVFPSEEPDQVSFVNGIDTYEGGSHVDLVRNRVADEVCKFLRKKHKLETKPQDVKNRLCFVVMTSAITNAKFRSQTKEYLASATADVAPVFADFDPEKFAREICSDLDLVDPIIQTFKLKQEARENVDVNREKREMSRVRVTKYIHANGKDRKKCVIFLAEGDSAMGQLANVRDSDIHGGFPLRGKPLNVNGCSQLEIIKNAEMKKLMAILGLELGEPANLDRLSYGTIALMADADHDGNCIVGLLMNFFALWPGLFQAGIVKICRSPIVKWEKGKQKCLYYDLADYMSDQQAKKIPGGATITYLKGLGSLQESEYREMVVNPRMETVIPDHVYRESLELVFGPDAAPRKPWLTGESSAG